MGNLVFVALNSYMIHRHQGELQSFHHKLKSDSYPACFLFTEGSWPLILHYSKICLWRAATKNKKFNLEKHWRKKTNDCRPPLWVSDPETLVHAVVCFTSCGLCGDSPCYWSTGDQSGGNKAGYNLRAAGSECTGPASDGVSSCRPCSSLCLTISRGFQARGPSTCLATDNHHEALPTGETKLYHDLATLIFFSSLPSTYRIAYSKLKLLQINSEKFEGTDYMNNKPFGEMPATRNNHTLHTPDRCPKYCRHDQIPPIDFQKKNFN